MGFSYIEMPQECHHHMLLSANGNGCGTSYIFTQTVNALKYIKGNESWNISQTRNMVEIRQIKNISARRRAGIFERSPIYSSIQFKDWSEYFKDQSLVSKKSIHQDNSLVDIWEGNIRLGMMENAETRAQYTDIRDMPSDKSIWSQNRSLIYRRYIRQVLSQGSWGTGFPSAASPWDSNIVLSI